MSDQNEKNNQEQAYDYSYVSSPARVACYDDLHSAPRITEIPPNTTTEYIEKLTTIIYEQSHMLGGSIPYTPIREVTENFIHAKFTEIIVSILDNGNTIRFADQGPGIAQKEKAKLPGFSSAIEPMKKYIRGVGSGLPIVKDYLDFQNGTITIEDNLIAGSVVTISLVQKEETGARAHISSETKGPIKKYSSPALSEREQDFIRLLYKENELRITDFINHTNLSNSTVFTTLTHLENLGLVEVAQQKRRRLTKAGLEIAQQI
jgi:predicted transcriptional regulator